jgi:hypothetical protein
MKDTKNKTGRMVYVKKSAAFIFKQRERTNRFELQRQAWLSALTVCSRSSNYSQLHRIPLLDERNNVTRQKTCTTPIMMLQNIVIW